MGLRDSVPVGATLSMRAGSAAQVLLAWEDQNRIVEGLRETLAAVTKHVPEARVVVIAPIGPASSPPPDLVRLRDAAAPVVRSSGAAWLDLDFPLTGHREWISPDSLHPNDAGYKRLAELTNARLK